MVYITGDIHGDPRDLIRFCGVYDKEEFSTIAIRRKGAGCSVYFSSYLLESQADRFRISNGFRSR